MCLPDKFPGDAVQLVQDSMFKNHCTRLSLPTHAELVPPHLGTEKGQGSQLPFEQVGMANCAMGQDVVRGHAWLQGRLGTTCPGKEEWLWEAAMVCQSGPGISWK